MKPVEPIYVAGLFPELHGELIRLLRGLEDDAWLKPTLAPAWRVRDVVAHLLDGQLRVLSFRRDGHKPPALASPVESYDALVGYLNALNAEWVKTLRRVSPKVLVDLLDLAGTQVCAFFATLDPHAPAVFPVAWAGEEVSANWFDIAREYTEWWHHQQQIREAVGAPPLTQPKWLAPVIDTSMRALPRTYREVPAEPGECIVFSVTGEAGGAWTLAPRGGAARWELFVGASPNPVARLTMDADTAWRLFFNALTAEQARSRISVEGRRDLGEVLARARAVMV